MYLLVAYDVSTKTLEGERRLRRVARICERHGQRVQNSLFECIVEPADYAAMKHDIAEIISSSDDTVRIYNLGERRSRSVDLLGRTGEGRLDDPLIL